MELKETIENLKLANDINTLSIEELANKYLRSAKRYSSFIKKYSNFFVYSPLYQLRVFNQYNKILELIDYGYVMYSSNGLDQLEKNILCQMNRNVTNFKLKRTKDDELQAKWIFDDTIGKNKVNNNESYEEVVKEMYDSAERYYKNNITHSQIMDSLYYINNNRTEKEKQKLFKLFCEKNPIIKNCNNIDFLYFVNYVLHTNSSKVDEEFIEDVKNTISESEYIRDNRIDRENYDTRNYKKMAKYTLKNIKRYEKNKAKKLKK